MGCALSHRRVLETLETSSLILEDDIGVSVGFQREFMIPPEADAIYLGVSNHGYVRGYTQVGLKGVVIASQYNEQYKRVFNMCSTHAILYLSERYIEAAHKKIEECLFSGLAFDLGLASIHKDYTILTPNDPFFYQREQEEFTNFSLQV